MILCPSFKVVVYNEFQDIAFDTHQTKMIKVKSSYNQYSYKVAQDKHLLCGMISFGLWFIVFHRYLWIQIDFLDDDNCVGD